MRLSNLGKVLTSRRKALGLFASGAVAAPLVAKQAADKSIAELAGTSMVDGRAWVNAVPGVYDNDEGNRVRTAIRMILADKSSKDRYESLIYRQHRHVGYLDLDIANKRSFSMAAKITFQRQRMVQRTLDEEANGNFWEAASKMIAKAKEWLPS